MNHSQNKQQHVTFNFDNVNERGLATFLRALSGHDAPVMDIVATNRATKKDGQRIKRVQLFFENQQQVDIFIGDAGDVAQLKINGKPTPFKASSEREFAQAIAQLLERGQASFDKSLAKKLKKIKVEMPQKKPASRSMKTRIAEADKLIEKAKENQETAQAELDKTNAERQVSIDAREAKVQELSKLREQAQGLRNQIETALAA